MPQKHANLQVDFFELKAVRTQPTQKRYFYSAATGAKGGQPPNVPLWHIDYFELKLTEKKQVQRNSDPPCPPATRK